MSCLGVGIDLVSVKRIAKIYSTFGDIFLNRFFSPLEALEAKRLEATFKCDNSNKIAMFCAKRFAVKEAFIKSVGNSFPIRLKEIDSMIKYNGKPGINLSGITQIGFNDFISQKSKTGCSVLVSVSDEEEFAIAIVFLNCKPH